PNEVLVSPDSRHVYVAAFGGDAVAVFARDTATGYLTYVQHQKRGVGGIQGLGSPFGLAISPDGAYLYAVGSDSFSVTVFARDTSTGALALVEEKFEGPTVSPACSGRNGSPSAPMARTSMWPAARATPWSWSAATPRQAVSPSSRSSRTA